MSSISSSSTSAASSSSTYDSIQTRGFVSPQLGERVLNAYQTAATAASTQATTTAATTSRGAEAKREEKKDGKESVADSQETVATSSIAFQRIFAQEERLKKLLSSKPKTLMTAQMSTDRRVALQRASNEFGYGSKAQIRKKA